MKILWLSPSDMVTEYMIGALESVGAGHDIAVCRYDRLTPPVDRGMLDAVASEKPDIALYISQAGGPYCAGADTFRRIRDMTKSVHLCLDAADIGWTELLEDYARKECFSLTVACDGATAGPVDWIGFHPVDPRPYLTARTHDLRPIALGTCGGFPYGLRRDVMRFLGDECGLVIKPREEQYGSYRRYANFLMACRIVPDCALSAGGPSGLGPYARTLKTRAIEVGLSGACLVELRGCALNRWADEEIDYATYETADEAVEVTKALLDDPRRAAAMAENLSQVVREKMSPAVFFATVFERLGC